MRPSTPRRSPATASPARTAATISRPWTRHFCFAWPPCFLQSHCGGNGKLTVATFRSAAPRPGEATRQSAATREPAGRELSPGGRTDPTEGPSAPARLPRAVAGVRGAVAVDLRVPQLAAGHPTPGRVEHDAAPALGVSMQMRLR